MLMSSDESLALGSVNLVCPMRPSQMLFLNAGNLCLECAACRNECSVRDNLPILFPLSLNMYAYIRLAPILVSRLVLNIKKAAQRQESGTTRATISSFHIWNTPGNLATNGNILMRILHTIAKSAPRVRPKIFGQADSSACRGLPPF